MEPFLGGRVTLRWRLSPFTGVVTLMRLAQEKDEEDHLGANDRKLQMRPGKSFPENIA